MPRRGKRSDKKWGDREDDDLLRLIRRAGGREQLIKRINKTELLEDFDDYVLPLLADMEDKLWKNQRTPEARRIFKRGNTPGRLLTREDLVRAEVEAHWPRLKRFGTTKEAVVRRLTSKLRQGVYKTPN
jgi:hypothetical protein